MQSINFTSECWMYQPLLPKLLGLQLVLLVLVTLAPVEASLKGMVSLSVFAVVALAVVVA